MLHWHSLVRLTDAELARIDISAVNLACAHGLPGGGKIDWTATSLKLESWAASCKRFTDAVMPQFHAGRHDPEDTEARFRVIAMISHLQHDLGVKYNPRCIPESAKFLPEDTFIHGITDGVGGTCASLPVLYTDIAHRLGYPIHLVATKCHLYCQWVGSDGERFNIEGSGEGVNFFLDEYFRTGRFSMPAKDRAAHGFDRPRTPRENLADFLTQRGFLFREMRRHRDELESFVWANEVAPHILAKRVCIAAAIQAWDDELRAKTPIWGFPNMEILLPLRSPFKYLPRDIERKWVGQLCTEDMLNDNLANAKWWEPLRRNPGVAPSNQLPTSCTVNYRWPSRPPYDFSRLQGAVDV